MILLNPRASAFAGISVDGPSRWCWCRSVLGYACGWVSHKLGHDVGVDGGFGRSFWIATVFAWLSLVKVCKMHNGTDPELRQLPDIKLDSEGKL